MVLQPRRRAKPVAARGRTLRKRSRTHRHRVSKEVLSLSVKIAGIQFDNVFYDREVDVLYLAVGDSKAASDFDASPEGHYLRYDANGALFGITIVNARRILEREGKIVITLPGRRVEATDLGDAL